MEKVIQQSQVFIQSDFFLGIVGIIIIFTMIMMFLIVIDVFILAIQRKRKTKESLLFILKITFYQKILEGMQFKNKDK